MKNACEHVKWHCRDIAVALSCACNLQFDNVKREK